MAKKRVEKDNLKKPYPSYIDGKLRDPDVEKMQASGFSQDDLKKLIGRGVARVRPARR